MKQNRNLLEELNVKGQKNACGPYAIDIQAIKGIVNHRIDSAYAERKIRGMKSKMKVSLIAAALTLVLGVTVFGASSIITSWYSSSSSISDYKSLPSAEQVAKDIGYEPILIEAFDNGYTFQSGNVVDNNLTDENNHSVEKFKSVMFKYEKDGDEVSFSQEKFDAGIDSIGDVVAAVEGVEVYYHSYTNKLVPPDYKMTDDDKKAKESGELVFSRGSDKVEIIEVQSVTWSEDGVHYLLMQMDGRLSADELAGMAKEVIMR